MNAINEHQEHVPCLNDEEAVPFFKSYVKRLGDEIAHLEHLALTDLDKEMKFQIHKMKGGASIYGLDKFRDSLLKLSESKSPQMNSAESTLQ